MTPRAGLITAIAVALTASTPAKDIGFYKSKIPGTGGKEGKVDLVFQGDAKVIAVSQYGNSIALVPYSAIEKLGYSYSKRHRVKEGVQAMIGGVNGIGSIVTFPLGVVAGSVLMVTKSKSHWFYIDYTDVSGSHEVILRLDKSEYQKILDTAKALTGKDVDMLPEQ